MYIAQQLVAKFCIPNGKMVAYRKGLYEMQENSSTKIELQHLEGLFMWL